MTLLHTTIRAQKDLATAQLQGWAHANAWWQQDMQVLRDTYKYPSPPKEVEPSASNRLCVNSDPMNAHLITCDATQKAVARARCEEDLLLLAELLGTALAILNKLGATEQLNCPSSRITSID